MPRELQTLIRNESEQLRNLSNAETVPVPSEDFKTPPASPNASKNTVYHKMRGPDSPDRSEDGNGPERLSQDDDFDFILQFRPGDDSEKEIQHVSRLLEQAEKERDNKQDQIASLPIIWEEEVADLQKCY